MLKQSSINREPKSLEEIKFQDNIIKCLQTTLREEYYPAAMLFHGSSGTGKTVTAKNFIKAARCLNREKGEVKSCGHCDVCKSDPKIAPQSSNVMWVQRGQSLDVGKQIKEVRDFITRPPEFSGMLADKEHTNRKFVVIDEAHTLTSDQLHDLFYLSEIEHHLAGNKVTIICISMDLERIRERSVETYNALRSRCERYEFLPPTNEQVMQMLGEMFPTYPNESLRIIAVEANRNMRDAMNCIDRCEKVDPELNPLSVAHTLRFADDAKRVELWRQICSKKRDRSFYYNLGQFVDKFLEIGIDERKLIQQMIEDVFLTVLYSNEVNEQDCFTLIKRLSDYAASRVPLSLNKFILLLAKEQFEGPDLNIVKDHPQVESVYEQVQAG